MINNFQKALISIKESIIEELDSLVSLNEDDFDRGQGKFIIRNRIEELKLELKELKDE